MSPRSTEFFEAAKRRLALAANAIDQDPGGALSAAYYSMLYATRAALSEHDKYAKTHVGTWHLFREEFVDTGLFDSDLAADAQAAQPQRERADYQAWAAPKEEAERMVDLASRFLTAVERLIAQIEES